MTDHQAAPTADDGAGPEGREFDRIVDEETTERPEIMIITGLSGAGRSTASNVVEDLGWFVIDNLPPTLISRVTELAFAPGSSVGRLALVVDVRGREFFAALLDTLRELRSSEADVRVLYLDADDDVLVRRFEETRRRHPAADGAGVLAGIRNERALLSDLRGMADLIIDTSGLNVHELRDRLLEVLQGHESAQLRIEIVSFGFKRGTPRDADLLFDVRFLPNPHWVEELRPFTGRDEPVRDYVFGQPQSEPFMQALQRLLDVVVPGYVQEGKRYLTIAIGCTGGKHRSVAISESIGQYLHETTDLSVNVQHRDLGHE
ncbi:RNase adapter RapZ [Egicoccus sp. AB-alg6-2]|uniref:RNase adapter RapZ n=1 Tax=Egicoccus sp. AB-alg6-2 TaxID=3242692 RepID=UPI00359EA452